MCDKAHNYCPRCLGASIKKNGVLGKYFRQQLKCKTCKKKFSLHSNTYYINDYRKNLIQDLLLERVSLPEICRVVKVSLTWLMAYLRNIWSDLPADLCAKISLKRKNVRGHFYIRIDKYEADEVWSFVQKRDNKQYIWFVQYRETAQKLWVKIPNHSQENGLFYTDDWDSYKTVSIPKPMRFDKLKPHRFFADNVVADL